MRNKEFGFKADVYSFGLILYEVVTGEELFTQYEEWADFEEAICERKERPSNFKGLPPSLVYLINLCCKFFFACIKDMIFFFFFK